MGDQSLIITQDCIAKCKKLILDCYGEYIPLWLAGATKTEIKGLKVASAIIKYEGKKKFRPRIHHDHLNTETTNDKLRKRYMRTYYNSEFCIEAIKHSSEVEILKFKRLDEMKYAKILKPVNIMFIQRWLNLNDEEIYQGLLLSFIRGIYSVVNAQIAVPNSNNREYYQNISVEDRKKALLGGFVRNVGIRGNKSTDRRPYSTDIGSHSRGISLFCDPETSKRRKLRDQKGNGQITSWITNVPIAHCSLYQESFASQLRRDIF